MKVILKNSSMIFQEVNQENTWNLFDKNNCYTSLALKSINYPNGMTADGYACSYAIPVNGKNITFSHSRGSSTWPDYFVLNSQMELLRDSGSDFSKHYTYQEGDAYVIWANMASIEDRHCNYGDTLAEYKAFDSSKVQCVAWKNS